MAISALRLFGSPLYRLERELILAPADRLSRPAAELLRALLELVNAVQRFSLQREVNLYRRERGKIAFPDIVRFPNRSPDLKLASLTFRAEAERVERAVTSFAVHGLLFTLLFDQSVRPVARRGLAEILTFQQYADPLSAAAEQMNIEIDAVLPIDLESPSPELAHELHRHHVTILAPEERRLVSIDQGDFYLLAERVDFGALALKARSTEGAVWFLSYGGEAPELTSMSFVEGLHKLATRSY